VWFDNYFFLEVFMNRIVLLFLLVITVILGGCINQHKWEVGDKTVHLLSYEGVAGPNVTSIWVEKDGVATPVYNASGTGLAPSLIAGSAQVGSAHLIGEGISKSGDRTTVTQGGASATGGSGSGGNASATGNGGAGGNATNQNGAVNNKN
jgi:hypothetical protein